MALSADPPPGLVAGASFGGGRGSKKPDQVCREDRLIAAFGEFGKRSRAPMLWVYAENDHFFGLPLAEKFHNAFVHAGGQLNLVETPAFAADGHFLFSAAGIPKWTPVLDDYLKARNLVARAQPLPPPRRPTFRPRRVCPRTDARTLQTF